jgi:hypothetical protein
MPRIIQPMPLPLVKGTQSGRFGVINWHRRRPREETVVLGQPLGAKTSIRMEPPEVTRTVESARLTLVRLVDLPPYHYGAIFEKPTM